MDRELFELGEQVGAALTSHAAWGSGNGTISGLTIDMTFSNVGHQAGRVSPDCGTIVWSPVGSTWTRTPPARRVSLPWRM